ncbi:hypothetical protein ACFE04_031207 [Oxalis oulophora]
MRRVQLQTAEMKFTTSQDMEKLVRKFIWEGLNNLTFHWSYGPMYRPPSKMVLKAKYKFYEDNLSNANAPRNGSFFCRIVCETGTPANPMSIWLWKIVSRLTFGGKNNQRKKDQRDLTTQPTDENNETYRRKQPTRMTRPNDANRERTSGKIDGNNENREQRERTERSRETQTTNGNDPDRVRE